MNGKNVLTRLQAVEQKLGTDKEDEERKAKAEEITELLRKYEECMGERRKLPVEEQQRLEKQETEEFLQWYREWHKAYDEWLKANEEAKREDWQAYIEWSDAWNLEWEKTHVKKQALFNKTVLQNKWIPHKPAITDDGRSPQAEFILLDCDEALYGGAAGGGKTDAILMGALRWVNYPGYNAIIFRKTLQDHKKPDGLIARTHEWLGNTEARWNGQDYKWTFPSGATLSLGYMDIDEDVYHHQGAAYNYIGWDELTQFKQWQYQYLISRNRRLENCCIPLQIRSATNPGGRGHTWVKQYFIIEGQKYGRVFIPALLDDNPYLDRRSYELALSKLDPTTRKQLREGSWEAAVGTMFHRDWFKVIPKAKAPMDLRKIRVWDLAATEPEKGKDPDWVAGVLIGMWQGQYYIYHMEHFRGSPKNLEDRIKRTAELDGKDVEVWMEEEGGSGGKITTDHYGREVLPGYAFRSQRSTGSKENRANPFSAATERGNVFLVEGDCISNFLDEAEVFPEGEHDDQVDACSNGVNILVYSRAPPGVGVAVIRKKEKIVDDD